MTSQDSTQEESEIACDSGRFALWVQDLGTYTSSSGKTCEEPLRWTCVLKTIAC
uniref:Uncharacterized protein n=1 Tax=Hyaloperonospora arabidopsidis (strain Emoy2) TaxID=559515 RepID=M4BUA5_HYAAE